MLGIALLLLIVLLALAVPVAAGLGFMGLGLSAIYSKLPLSLAMGEISWATSNNFLLVAIPFFVLLGEILLRSGMAERMYNALVLWVPWLPGGLMHTNIVACAMFAATSGSSVATAATIGTVALGEIKKRGYSEPLFLGTIAAGGTLGILIPPSINMIVYGVLTETSIPKLYLAGFIPGFVLASLFCLVVLICCLVRPEWGGKPTGTSWAQRVRVLPDLIPPFVIFLAVIGSIYAGWATATESAALGVIAALGIAAAHRKLSVKMLKNAFEGTMRTTAMIMAILIAAYCLNFVMSSIGLMAKVNNMILGLKLSPGAAALRGDRVLRHPRHVHGDPLHDGGDRADHRSDHVQGGLRSGLVRHPVRDLDRDGDDHAAGRHQSICGPGIEEERTHQRRDQGLFSVRVRHVRHAGDPLVLAGPGPLSAADGGQMSNAFQTAPKSFDGSVGIGNGFLGDQIRSRKQTIPLHRLL